MSEKNEQHSSYLCGEFCATLQQMEEIAYPTHPPKDEYWVEGLIILFQVNLESTLQLMEEILNHFPSQIYNNEKVYIVKDLIRLYNEFAPALFHKEPVEAELFRAGYLEKRSTFA